VGSGAQQIVREARRALAAGLVEVLWRGAEMLGIEADVVTREQHRGAVAGGVFHRLGSHRRSQLLEAHAGVAPYLALGRWQLAQRLAAEPALQVIEQRSLGIADGFPGGCQGALEERLVLRGAAG